jgi:hypothetical protein
MATRPFESLLTPPQREALKAALTGTRSGTPLSASRATVHEISEGAGLSRQTPEHSLVAFKALINDAANECGIPLGRDRANLLDRFVSLFIEEFYTISRTGPVEDVDCRGKLNRIIPAEIRDTPVARL